MTFPPEVETCDFVTGVETYDLGAGARLELVGASEAVVGDEVVLGTGGL